MSYSSGRVTSGALTAVQSGQGPHRSRRCQGRPERTVGNQPFRVPGERPGPSNLAVSFVVSFQTRWASFGDPNRWLFRFEEEMREISDLYDRGLLLGASESDREFRARRPGILRRIDHEMHERLFPGYWHSSDYMSTG